MARKAFLKYVSLMMLILQMVLTVFTFIGLFGGSTHPSGNTAAAMCVYVLPFLIGLNVFLLLYWLIKKEWFIGILPFLGIVCSIPYLLTLVNPIGIITENSNDPGVKVATYNVAMFGRQASGFIAQDIFAAMKQESVDILCIQEYNDENGDRKNSDTYKEYFPYIAYGNKDMVIYSRYPITDSGNIPFDNTNNSAMWADVKIKKQTVRIFNVHLQTTGFNRTLYKAAKQEAQGNDVEANKLLEAVYGNYTVGMVVRAGQADIVAREMSESPHPLIVCGDFNDVPYSYVYHAMKGDLKDGFREAGRGWASTYRGGKAVRIDYIFHDESIDILSYYKRKMTYSDHYPVFIKLAL